MNINLKASVKLGLALVCFMLLGIYATTIGGSVFKFPWGSNQKADHIKLLPGFKAEHLYSPSGAGNGSWVSMTFDDKGRMIASDQYGYLYRLTIPPVGADTNTTKIAVEKLEIMAADDTTMGKIKMGFAHGLLYAFNSLYVMVNHNPDSVMHKNSGLYRLQDTNGDDQYDKITLLKRLITPGGEHGPHSIILSPDKQSIYVIAGNHTDAPPMDSYRLPKTWKEDNLFPLIKDPNGHANDILAPGGWIANVDSTGTKWELVSAGYRNPFDIAFNEDGELFTYDADMEWDFGMPWYRPTRINHVTSGSEYGWRTGNSKWSPAYPDNLPAVLNIGQGSPTNLISGKTARFPEKYRRSLFAFDWSFGIIYSILLKPEGSSYKANAEVFASGTPLPLTDGMIGPDGALYFLTGGRRLESDLYRIYHGNNTGTNEVLTSKLSGSQVQAQNLRKKLEQFHNGPNAAAVTTAWPYLSHPDRFIRYAARIAIEHQPVSEWQEKAFSEKNPQALTQAIVALARTGDSTLAPKMITALASIKNYSVLPEAQKIDILRAFELIVLRHGTPTGAAAKEMIAYLNPKFPAGSNELNRLLSKILVFVEAPGAVAKTMALMATAKDDKNDQKTFTGSEDLVARHPQYGLDIAGMLAKTPPAQQIYYATVLGDAKSGWTTPLREKYFKWFNTAFTYRGGNSYIGFIEKSRQMALAKVPKEKFEYYNNLSGSSLLVANGNRVSFVGNPKGPGRNWKLEDAVAAVSDDTTNRNFAQGKMLFSAALCASCHRMRGEGGSSGPDLSQVGTRFTPKDILESIIHPNKVISDQYAATEFTLKDGSTIFGRLKNEEGGKYYVSTNPFSPNVVETIAVRDVVDKKLSDVSIMFPGTINRLNKEEVKDLLAYLVSGANKNHEIYKPKNATTQALNEKKATTGTSK
jgi:putative heme-binding domain-containing protein